MLTDDQVHWTTAFGCGQPPSNHRRHEQHNYKWKGECPFKPCAHSWTELRSTHKMRTQQRRKKKRGLVCVPVNIYGKVDGEQTQWKSIGILPSALVTVGAMWHLWSGWLHSSAELGTPSPKAVLLSPSPRHQIKALPMAFLQPLGTAYSQLPPAMSWRYR